MKKKLTAWLQSLLPAMKNGPIVLLVLLSFTVFLAPLLPPLWFGTVYRVLLFSIAFPVVFYLEKKHRVMPMTVLGILLILLFISFFVHSYTLDTVSRGLNILFFSITVVQLLNEVLRSKVVTRRIILQSINGYLLMGLVFAIFLVQINLAQPDAFTFPVHEHNVRFGGFYNHIYFAFVSMSTVGYGDIVPKTPFAKSYSTLMSVAGQLYLTIVIAMLVGKYISGRGKIDPAQ